MGDPDVFVVLKEGDSHGTRHGTPLCVELTERDARARKIGRCVCYVPRDEWIRALDETKTQKNQAVIQASNAQDIITQLRARIETADRLATALRASLGHPSMDGDRERQVRDLLFEYIDG